MAPEVVKNPLKDHPDDFKNENRYHYNMVVDSWAVGCLAYELLVGYPPFTANTQQQVVQNINNMQVSFPKRVSEEAIDFIKGALERVPADRATTMELIKHPWIQQHMVSKFPLKEQLAVYSATLPMCSVAQAAWLLNTFSHCWTWPTLEVILSTASIMSFSACRSRPSGFFTQPLTMPLSTFFAHCAEAWLITAPEPAASRCSCQDHNRLCLRHSNGQKDGHSPPCSRSRP